MYIPAYDAYNRLNVPDRGNADFNTRDMSAEAAASGIADGSLNNTEIKPSPAPFRNDDGAELRISDSASMAVRSADSRKQTAGGGFAPVNFNTGSGNDSEAGQDTGMQKSTENDRVLSRYRYFVRNTRYEGSEGIVRRIFG